MNKLEQDMKEWRAINWKNHLNVKVGQEVEAFPSYYTTCNTIADKSFFPATVIDITWHKNEDRSGEEYQVATLYNSQLKRSKHIGVPWLKQISIQRTPENSKIYNLAYKHKSKRVRKKNMKRLLEMVAA